jgi:hypothetical protein
MKSTKDFVREMNDNLKRALAEIMVKEKETSRVISSRVSDSFIEELGHIIDKWSKDWNGEEKNNVISKD